MCMSQNPLCSLPFVQVHVKSDGSFRECCQTNPQLDGQESKVIDWWYHNADLNEFRASLIKPKLPTKCSNCELQESVINSSYRIEINKQTNIKDSTINFPSRWHICFSNKCNLACWTCSETFSSVIEKQKHRLGKIDIIESIDSKFNKLWDSDLKDKILESYNHHDIINLSFLGGEPTYNKKLLDFLKYLIDNNLSNRTRLELTTNGTQPLDKIHQLLDKKVWKYISVFISIDAIGKKAEWVRYGSVWKNIDDNVNKIKDLVEYCEIQSTISILNIANITDVYDYAKSQGLKFTPSLVSDPEFMNLKSWDGNNLVAGRLEEFRSRNLQDYYWMIGSESVPGSKQRLKEYIESFNLIRDKRLKDYDPILSNELGLF